MERLGIIGGMGPAATARLFTRIIDFTDVQRDQDHLDIRIVNNPAVPDRTAYVLGQEGAEPFAPLLNAEARELEKSGCTVLALPCNSSHTRLDEIAAGLESARIVNMIAETGKFAASLGCTRAGILATSGTVACKVYQDAFAELGIGTAVPQSGVQDRVMEVIYSYVKAGKPVPDGLFESACDSLVAEGCDALILGCTELSLLSFPLRYRGIAAVDALDVLAWRCVAECGAPAKDLRALYA